MNNAQNNQQQQNQANSQQQIVCAPTLLSPIRYPSRNFESFQGWVRHFRVGVESISSANDWDDQRRREGLPRVWKVMRWMSITISPINTFNMCQ